MITNELLTHTDPMWLLINAAEFAIALVYLRRTPWRSDDVRAIGAETLFGFAAWHGVHLIHPDFIFDFLLNVAVLTGYGSLSRQINARQALYFASTFVLCTEIGKVACADLGMQSAYSLLHGLDPLAITAVWAAGSLGFTLVAGLVLGRWVFAPGTERLSWRQCLLVLLPLVPYVYIRASYFYLSVVENGAFYWNYLWIMIILSACTAVMVVGNASNLSAQLERNELVRMQMLLKEQNANYLAQQQANEAVRSRYHDLKHYLAEFEQLLRERPQGDAERLLADMRRELDVCGSDVETGNEVLDVVLAGKTRACADVGVRPVFYADASCLSFMSAFDLCAVFGNLLDNAIEAASALGGQAASTIGAAGAGVYGADASRTGAAGVAASEANAPETSMPEVTLSVRRQKGFAVVRCTNPYGSNLRPEADGFATTKPDRDNHGIGLRSVRATVERYGGALTLEADEGVFTATVILPIPDEGEGNGRPSAIRAATDQILIAR